MWHLWNAAVVVIVYLALWSYFGGKKGKKKMEVVPVFSGQCSSFLAVLFSSFIHLYSPVTRCAVVGVDAEKRAHPRLFVFLGSLLKRKKRFLQEWRSLLFQTRIFPREFACFEKPDSSRFNAFCSNGRLAAMLPKDKRSGPFMEDYMTTCTELLFKFLLFVLVFSCAGGEALHGYRCAVVFRSSP